MAGAILCDIEGTTSSISFVRDVLFPYAAKHLPAFVRDHHDEPPVREALLAAASEAGLPPDDTEALIARLLAWIDADRKSTPLKALQGMIWVRGYESGDYRAHMYEDAHRRLTEWHRSGTPLYVYSSGSVQAQRLFFRYTCFGDLRALWSGHFDTRIGPKRDADSYRSIISEIGRGPDEVLFLSDVEAELDAARIAGLETTLIVRPEDSALAISETESAHPIAATFDEVSA